MLKDIEINELLELDEKLYFDYKKCYQSLKHYIENIKESKFSADNTPYLIAIVDKFLQFADINSIDLINYPELMRQYSEKLIYTCNPLTNEQQQSESDVSITANYHNLYSMFFQIHNKIDYYFRSNTNEFMEFGGLFDYSKSNKKRIILSIQNAIDLLEKDTLLSEKSKHIIIKYLSDSIKELNNPKTNWNGFMKKVSEAIIVIRALGSIVCCIDASNNLLKAQSEIEGAKKMATFTSINLNYTVIEQTFNMGSNIEIENNQIIQIESARK